MHKLIFIYNIFHNVILDGKPRVLKGNKKCKATTTLTVEAKKQKLIMVPENFVKNVNERLKVDEDKDVEYATVDDLNKRLKNYSETKTVNGLQSTVQKIQQENISSAAKYATKVDVEKNYVKKEQYEALEQRLKEMQNEYEAKLKELGDAFMEKVSGITNKLNGVKNALSD